jgi:hypothetical protein
MLYFSEQRQLFWKEISKRIVHELKFTGIKHVKIVLPFPKQQLVEIDLQSGNRSVALQNPYRSVDWPLKTFQKKIILLVKFIEIISGLIVFQKDI